MKIRRRLKDGSYGDLEEVFPSQIDDMALLMLEALAGQQEQIMMMQLEIEQLKGGGE